MAVNGLPSKEAGASADGQSKQRASSGGFGTGKAGRGIGSLYREIWQSGAWRLMPMVFIYVLGLAILLPSKADILTNFFASQEAGYAVECQHYAVGVQPETCRNAHSEAVWWNSISDFVSHSIITFLLAPMIGNWSDLHGRKHFIVLALAFAGLPILMLVAHIDLGLSLYAYFPANALSGTSALMSLCAAYIADVISPGQRAAAIGFTMASFASAFLVGPALGGVIGTGAASFVAALSILAALLWVLIFLPESLSAEAKAAAREKQRHEGACAQAPWHSLRLLGRSPLYIKLTLCVVLLGVVNMGIMELLAQYLQLKLSYGKADLAILMTIAGATGLLTQTVVLRVLMRYLGETRILVTSTVSSVAEQVILAAAQSKISVAVGVVVGNVANLAMPAISSLMSKHAEVHEQGVVQGALYGALALAQGLGPLLFAFLFGNFTRTDSDWIYYPGAPYLVGALLMVCNTAVACTINGREADRGIHRDDDYIGGRGPGDEESLFDLQSSGDLATAGSVSLMQRHSSSTLAPGKQHTASGGRHSASLEPAPTQKRSSLEMAGARKTASLELPPTPFL